MTTSSKKDNISTSLGLAPIEITPPQATNKIFDQPTEDFEYARGNMINIIEKGNEALDGILNVAGQSQHPRSYEVAANLIKTLVDAQKDLLELQKRKKDLNNESNPKTVNNNLFVGSTAELQKLIKNQNDE